MCCVFFALEISSALVFHCSLSSRLVMVVVVVARVTLFILVFLLLSNNSQITETKLQKRVQQMYSKNGELFASFAFSEAV